MSNAPRTEGWAALRVALTLVLLLVFAIALTAERRRGGGASPPSPAAVATGATLTGRIVFVLVDSLDQHDVTADRMPFLATRLSARSLSGPMQSCGLMATLACLRTMFEGRDSPLTSGFANFAASHRSAAADSWPAVLKRHGARLTAIGDHTLPALYGDALARAETYEAHGLPLTARDDFAFAEARRWLAASAAGDALILHLTDADKIAHHASSQSAEHRAAFLKDDRFLEELAASLGPADTLVVTGDHGHQHAPGGHTRTTAYWLAGTRFPAGQRLAIKQPSLLFFLNAIVLEPLSADYEGEIHAAHVSVSDAERGSWIAAQAAAWGTAPTERAVTDFAATRTRGLARARIALAAALLPLLLLGLWLLGLVRSPRSLLAGAAALGAAAAAGAFFEAVRGHLHYNDHVATGAIFFVYYGVYLVGGGLLLSRLPWFDGAGSRVGRWATGAVVAAALLSFVSPYHYGSFRAVPTLFAAALAAVFLARRDLERRVRLLGLAATALYALGSHATAENFIRAAPLGSAYGHLPAALRALTEASVAVLVAYLLMPWSRAPSPSTRRFVARAAAGAALIIASRLELVTGWPAAAVAAVYLAIARGGGLVYVVFALEAAFFKLAGPGAFSLVTLVLAAALVARTLPPNERGLATAAAAIFPATLFAAMLTGLGLGGIDFSFAFPLVRQTVTELPWALQIALLAGLKYFLPQLLLPLPPTAGARWLAAKALLMAAFFAGARIDVERRYHELAFEELALLALVLLFPLLREALTRAFRRLYAPITSTNRTVPVPMP